MPTLPKKLRPTDLYIQAAPGWQDRTDGLLVSLGAPSSTLPGYRLFRIRVPLPVFGGSEAAEPLSADIAEVEPSAPGVIVEQVAEGGSEGGVGV